MPYSPMYYIDVINLVEYFKYKPFILCIEGKGSILSESGIDISIKNKYIVVLAESSNKIGIEYRVYFNITNDFPRLIEANLVTNKMKEGFNNTINRIDLGRALIRANFLIGRNNC